MPKVTHVKKARKARRKYGIRKGQEYWWWRTRAKGQKCGVTHYSATRPRESQLTMSEYKQAYWSIVEDFDDLALTPPTSESEAEDFAAQLREYATQFRDLGIEQDEKFNAMPESLQGGSTGDLIQSRIDQCETTADMLELSADDISNYTEDEMSEVVNEIANICFDGPE